VVTAAAFRLDNPEERLVLRPDTIPALSLAVTVLLAGCSSENTADPISKPTGSQTSAVTPSVAGSPPSTSPTATPTKPPTDSPLLSVTIDGEEVLPNAQEIDLSVGEPLLIEIESDRAGELHVHSSPEQFIEFAAGTADAKLVIKTPGQIEVEDHQTRAVVALLTVR
jgi:hypothetical protein